MRNLLISECKTADAISIGIDSMLYAIAPSYTMDTRGNLRKNVGKPQVLRVCVTEITFMDHYLTGVTWRGYAYAPSSVKCKASRLSKNDVSSVANVMVEIGPYNCFASKEKAEEALEEYKEDGLAINCGEPPMTRAFRAELERRRYAANNGVGEWILTDSDTMQFRRSAAEKGDGVYELAQVNQYGDNLFHVAHGFVYPSDIDSDERESLISEFGWSKEDIESETFPALLAEAAFESSATEYDTNDEYKSFEEAAAALCDLIGVPYKQEGK